jgi:hypothetical protein
MEPLTRESIRAQLAAEDLSGWFGCSAWGQGGGREREWICDRASSEFSYGVKRREERTCRDKFDGGENYFFLESGDAEPGERADATGASGANNTCRADEIDRAVR